MITCTDYNFTILGVHAICGEYVERALEIFRIDQRCVQGGSKFYGRSR